MCNPLKNLFHLFKKSQIRAFRADMHHQGIRVEGERLGLEGFELTTRVAERSSGAVRQRKAPSTKGHAHTEILKTWFKSTVLVMKFCRLLPISMF